MAKRTSLLGWSRPSERLTREEIAVLDKVTLPPEPPAKPLGKNGGGPQRMVPKDLLTFRWSLECPGCGFKVTGDGQPPARATPGEVRPLQRGPRPRRRVMVRTTTAPCSRGNGRTIPRLVISLTNEGVAHHKQAQLGRLVRNRGRRVGPQTLPF